MKWTRTAVLFSFAIAVGPTSVQTAALAGLTALALHLQACGSSGDSMADRGAGGPPADGRSPNGTAADGGSPSDTAADGRSPSGPAPDGASPSDAGVDATVDGLSADQYAGPEGRADAPVDASLGDVDSDAYALDAGPDGFMPDVGPPPTCTGLPEAGASCTVAANPACLLGDFNCACQCSCASCQGHSPCPCTGPCDWACDYEYGALVTNPSASVVVDCTGPTPAFVVTADVDYTVPVGSPAVSIDTPDIYTELTPPGPTASGCSIDVAAMPTNAGPVPPGGTVHATYMTRPISACNTATGSVSLCTFCGGTALVYLSVAASGGALSAPARDWLLGAQPSGTSYPITCH